MTEHTKYLDIVIGGPDHSGTSTQIDDAIKLFQSKGLVVKDLRGGEAEALFHAIHIDSKEHYLNKETFHNANGRFARYRKSIYDKINEKMNYKQFASMVQNNISTYIEPNSADVWVLEEPSNRKVGTAIRQNILYASKFGIEFNKMEEAQAYSLDRKIEYMLFRGPMREAGKIILRSRSEESAAYQLYDAKFNKLGPKSGEFQELEGNKNAFINGPTHIFTVSGDQYWTLEDSRKLQKTRGSHKNADDKELNIEYQYMVNRRYGTKWVENLYEIAKDKFGCKMPKFYWMNIIESKETIKKEFDKELSRIYENWIANKNKN